MSGNEGDGNCRTGHISWGLLSMSNHAPDVDYPSRENRQHAALRETQLA